MLFSLAMSILGRFGLSDDLARRFAAPFIILLGVVLVLGAYQTYDFFNDRAAVAEHEREQEAKAAKQRAKADVERVADAAKNAQSEKDLHNAIDDAPGGTLLLLPMLLLVSACGSLGGFPPLADLKAVTESKPIPGDEIATDPQAEARFNADIESWGDRLHSAGSRLCRFYHRVKMPDVNFCPKAGE